MHSSNTNPSKVKDNPNHQKDYWQLQNYTKKRKQQVKKDRRVNCGTCSNLLERWIFHFKQEQGFTSKINFTCASENVIYVIACSVCERDYIGLTRISVRWRTILHKELINFPRYRQKLLSKQVEGSVGNLQLKSTVFHAYHCEETISLQKWLNKENVFIQKYKLHLNMNA